MLFWYWSTFISVVATNAFKEAFLGMPITVSLEISGLSEDGMFFKIVHNVYDDKGKNLAHCDLLGAWINLKTRKLTELPQDFLIETQSFPKTSDFKILTKEDTRKNAIMPKDLVG